jgi:hypothetical protein
MAVAALPRYPRRAADGLGSLHRSTLELKLWFAAKEEAIAYAEQNGIPYRVFEPHPRALSKKPYSDNFKFGRIGTWTH